MHPLLTEFLGHIEELSASDCEKIAPLLQVETFPKGKILVQPGEIASDCYFILEGCIRQYRIQNDKERTTGFFEEHQTVVSFTSYAQQEPVDLYWECLEPSVVIVGAMDQEMSMYASFPKLELVTRRMMAENFGEMQQQWAALMTATPPERYLHLLETRPGLLLRVPQHQLASYMGVTPESLSRIRRRIREQERK